MMFVIRKPVVRSDLFLLDIMGKFIRYRWLESRDLLLIIRSIMNCSRNRRKNHKNKKLINMKKSWISFFMRMQCYWKMSRPSKCSIESSPTIAKFNRTNSKTAYRANIYQPCHLHSHSSSNSRGWTNLRTGAQEWPTKTASNSQRQANGSRPTRTVRTPA